MDEEQPMPRARLRHIIPLTLFLLAGAAAVTYLLATAGSEVGPLTASGTVESVEIAVSAELAGRVQEVFVEKGERVEAGQPLLRQDDELLLAQRLRAEKALQSAEARIALAEAGLEAARASLQVAEHQVEAAQIQRRIALAAALGELGGASALGRGAPAPEAFDWPQYFGQQESRIQAAEALLALAQQDLETAEADLQNTLLDLGGEELSRAEADLRETRSAYSLAQDLNAWAEANGDSALQQAAADLLDRAERDLQQAQNDFRSLLEGDEEGDETQELESAHAQVALHAARVEQAQLAVFQELTGEHALQVQAASSGVRGAQAGLAQAQANLAQAQANLKQAHSAHAQARAEVELIDLQLGKLTLRSPVAGVVLTRGVEPGEVLPPGGRAMTLGRLEALTITVYLPEDRYGQVQIGDQAHVAVDSFPEALFTAEVIRIADRAEFTPRNVQTEEGRRTTVYAVELVVSDPEGRLKPGMPADVTFPGTSVGTDQGAG
jgi:multidrug resistance efflux pump